MRGAFAAQSVCPGCSLARRATETGGLWLEVQYTPKSWNIGFAVIYAGCPSFLF